MGPVHEDQDTSKFNLSVDPLIHSGLDGLSSILCLALGINVNSVKCPVPNRAT